MQRGNRGICAQLDFTATPKHNDGSLFRHIVVDFPLGEAVDAGIVKVPVLGELDELVPLKASAAVEWCKVASLPKVRWRYLYVPYHLFQQRAATMMAELARACQPTLKGLLDEWKSKQLALPLEEATAQSQADRLFEPVLREAGVAQPPAKVADFMRQAVLLQDHAIRSRQPTLAPAFQPLLGPLDEYALRILEKQLKPLIPSDGVLTVKL